MSLKSQVLRIERRERELRKRKHGMRVSNRSIFTLVKVYKPKLSGGKCKHGNLRNSTN